MRAQLHGTKRQEVRAVPSCVWTPHSVSFLEASEGQESSACCSSPGHRVGHDLATEHHLHLQLTGTQSNVSIETTFTGSSVITESRIAPNVRAAPQRQATVCDQRVSTGALGLGMALSPTSDQSQEEDSSRSSVSKARVSTPEGRSERGGQSGKGLGTWWGWAGEGSGGSHLHWGKVGRRSRRARAGQGDPNIKFRQGCWSLAEPS